ncbi:sulfotransferase [Planomonospora parontospora subsp. parontospora]|uniref:Sulfotransferase n=2 Tax=Planomonospora parontospora TaxID=58119 RepID=A0AA37F308_9ACTN|nr:sulfotransferase [Planomonospora parontospora]GGK55814.1 sulfotransferase [Planomonospora parontospora]GII07331.1 sulfotransferase [Planomonospora parontospora subsp. parontospora]
MQSDRPVFVIGCPRSGTTMLQLMLHAHPRIAVPPETRFMISAYQRRLHFGDFTAPVCRREFAEWLVGRRQSRFHVLGLDAAEVTREIVDGPGTLGSALGIVLRAYAARFGKPRWGDKRPSYFQNVDVLLRLFPDAQFVHLIRDGRDCVASLKEMPWHTGTVHSSVSVWAEAVDFSRSRAPRLPAGSYHELRYEDLTRDPETQLRGLCAFLGEDFDPVMCEPKRVAGIAVPGHKTWHARTHGEVTTARSGSWRDRLEPWEVSLCESVLGDRLEGLGYELSGAAKASRTQLLAYERTTTMRRLARTKRAALDRLVRLREPNPVAARLTSAQLRLAGLPGPEDERVLAGRGAFPSSPPSPEDGLTG